MNDKQAFERVMKLMGMQPKGVIVVPGGALIEYEDTGVDTDQFSTRGYDEFYAGAIFDGSGNIVKGYIDSHVAAESGICKEIRALKET